MSAHHSPNPAGGSGIGQAVPRNEDVRFITGRGCYVDDLQFPGMLHAVVVRSPQAHARIVSIDADAARAMPGVHAVFSYQDIARYQTEIPIRLGPLPGFERYLQRPFARDRVRYVGEPVALVIADDRYIAEDAAERVQVEYESLPPVVHPEAAMTDTDLIHPEVGTNLGTRYTVKLGNAADAFAGAAHTLKDVFYCHRHGSVPMETRGLLVVPDGDKLNVWGATKVNFYNRRLLAKMLDIPVPSIEMIETDIGGSFGVRGEFYPEDFLIPFAAKQLGRPVKWIEDRREHLMAANHSREMECELEIALAADGTLLGMRGRIVADMGAYIRTNGSVVPGKAAQFLPGPYRIPHYECEVLGVLTNKTPVGTYRAPGRYEANFFRERLFDLACQRFGFDRAEFRRKNLIGPDEMPYKLGKLVPYESETEYDGGDYPSLFDRSLKEFEYSKIAALAGSLREGKLHGVGIACFVESSGAGPAETARVLMKGEGRYDIYVGSSSSGQGHETSMAQILAEDVGVPITGIKVFLGSTSFVPQGYGTYHSRAIVMGGSAIKLAGQKLIAQLLALAASQSGHPLETLEFRKGNVYARGQSAPLLDLDALAGRAGSDAELARALEAMATFEQSKRTYTYGAHLAHVAVDPQTAQVDVLRYLAVEDIGRAVNPLIVHGQAIGAAVQGLGGTFLDEFKYSDDGQLLTGSFADYLLPTATDFPVVEALTLEESPSRLNPLGVKGAGEGGIVAVGGAVANAVAHALAPLGAHITDLPLSPNNLSRVIREARARHGKES
jgi:carbon-monoxide dehydrogenase large subunit